MTTSNVDVSTIFNHMKKFVWVVKVGYSRNDNKICTGLCVSKNGFIVTSSFRLLGASRISVRRFDDGHFIDAHRVGSSTSNNGLTLLKLNENTCDFAEIVEDVVSVGTCVLGIGHQPPEFTFTCLTGNVVSPLRMKSEFSINDQGLLDFVHTLRTDIRFQEIAGFDCSWELDWTRQTLGAPVFNVSGGVIGLIVVVNGGYSYMISGTHLKSFLGQFPTIGAPRSGEGSSSQQAPRSGEGSSSQQAS